MEAVAVPARFCLPLAVMVLRVLRFLRGQIDYIQNT